MNTVITAASSVLTLAGDVFDVVIENEVLVFIMAAGFVGIAISVLRRIINASKSVN